MDYTIEENITAGLSPEETRRRLFEKQRAMLDLFLQKGAISRTQHDRSLGDLREKMHF